MAATSVTARTWLWSPWTTVLVPLAFLLCMAPQRLLEMLVFLIRGWHYSGFKTTFTSLVETLNKLVLHVNNEEWSYFFVKSKFWYLFCLFNRWQSLVRVLVVLQSAFTCCLQAATHYLPGQSFKVGHPTVPGPQSRLPRPENAPRCSPNLSIAMEAMTLNW